MLHGMLQHQDTAFALRHNANESMASAQCHLGNVHRWLGCNKKCKDPLRKLHTRVAKSMLELQMSTWALVKVRFKRAFQTWVAPLSERNSGVLQLTQRRNSTMVDNVPKELMTPSDVASVHAHCKGYHSLQRTGTLPRDDRWRNQH